MANRKKQVTTLQKSVSLAPTYTHISPTSLVWEKESSCFKFKPLTPSLRLFAILIRSRGWGKKTPQSPRRSNKRDLRPWHTKGPQLWNSQRTTDVVRRLLANNAAAASCTPLPALWELTAFQAHGHCVQPCESEQVTHTSWVTQHSLEHPQSGKRDGGETKAMLLNKVNEMWHPPRRSHNCFLNVPILEMCFT